MKRISIFIALAVFMLNANAVDFKPDGFTNGYPYVEMCGLKWACYNVGATKPTEYGNYYAWGETQPAPNNEYVESNCRLYGKNVSDIGGDSRYDAARANWGSTWRLPTVYELIRLLEQCECHDRIVLGVFGLEATDHNTGKSIFLPYAGNYWGNFKSDSSSKYPFTYWTSTIVSDDDNETACALGADDTSYRFVGSNRYGGYSVRPVSD